MPRKAKTEPEKQSAEVVIGYKGHDKDLCCSPNGKKFQYEIGKTYDNGGKPVVRCGDGSFHSVEMPQDAFSYYGPATSRYTLTESTGEIARDENSDTKIGAAVITIKCELSIGDLTRRAVQWVADRAKKQGNGQFAAGSGGHASAAGDYGHASAAGDYGHASAAGYYGHASAAGYRGHASAAGDYGHASAAGYRGHASAAGDYGHASVKGKSAIAHAPGIGGTATAHDGGAISLAAYDDNNSLVTVRSSMVGQNGIEAGKIYRLTVAGEFEEVPSAEGA